MLALWKALILNSLSWLVSQILGNPLDHSSFAVLSWLVVRIHWAGFGVWIAETWTAALYIGRLPDLLVYRLENTPFNW